MGLVACTGDGSPSPPTNTTVPRPPTLEELAQARAVALTRDLLEATDRARPNTAANRALVNGVRETHVEQLEALGASTVSSGTVEHGTTSPTTSMAAPSTAAASDGSTVEPSQVSVPVSLPVLARQEFAAAETMLSDASGVEPGLATLLTRLAAGLAANADLLARAGSAEEPGVARPRDPATSEATGTSSTTASGASTPPGRTPMQEGSSSAEPSPSSSTSALTPPAAGSDTRPPPSSRAIASWSQELDGEHAAVYVYGLLAGRLSGAAKDLALRNYAVHLGLRDALERRLLAAGSEPPPAAAAYDLGTIPTTRAQAAELAARVEGAVASTAAQTVGVTETEDRDAAAARLVAAARRGAHWTGRPSALPGAGASLPSSDTSASATDPTGGPTVVS